jgi:hypothetical protein
MKRRFVQDPVTLELVEVGDEYQPGPRSNTDSVLWNDRTYQEMGDGRFTSRQQHRDYMKQHGLTTVDDYSNQWKNQERRRVEVAQGIDSTRKEHLAQTLHKLRG